VARRRARVKSHVRNIDCVKGMAGLPDSCVDLVVTDPPFAIGFAASRGNYNRTDSRVMRGYGEVRAEDYAEFTRSWMAQARRVMSDDASMYVFSGWNNLKDVLAGLDATGLTTVNHIVWKYQFGVYTRKKFVTSHYHCLYACKDPAKRRFYPSARFAQGERTEGGHSARYRDMEDVWEIRREYWTGRQKTPTKLPRELVEKILAYSSAEGDLVLDPFLGSGQVAVVAALMGRAYVGFEVSREYCEFARRRLESGRYLP